MVAKEKEAARQAFARLFNAELDRVEIPTGRSRISEVYNGLHKDRKKLVSREQVRKWIRGIDIPDQANLQLVVERLKLDWTRLQMGASSTAATPMFLEMKTAWEALGSDSARRAAIDYIQFLGTREGAPIKARAEGPQSEVDRATLQRQRRA